MSLMIMKHSISDTIRGAMPEEENAKSFLSQIAYQFVGSKKDKVITYFFCKKGGHVKKDCPKYAKWLVKNAEVENQLGKKIKVVKSNHGGEYYGRYDGSGEQRPRPFYTMLGTPSQNGVAERRNWTLKDMIYQDRSHGILGLSQKTYIDKVLSRFGMKDCDANLNRHDLRPNKQDTPIAKGDKFILLQCLNNEINKKEMENIPYASIVGSLMYAQVCMLLDIVYVAGMLGRYLRVVSWKSVKQSLIATSTMEVEFIACYEASNQAIWLRNFITGLCIIDGIERPLRINRDNKAKELYSKNNRSSSKSKHIDLKFLVVKERV
ncbi:hypothetical protein AAG906_003152 [Vitis piasezkii]